MNKTLKKKAFFLPEISVFALALFSRFLRLDVPGSHIFDEVYHAFTASQMFKGNPAAWEWWNTPPKGFAYEWTHPPLAKEFMVFAISIFGDSAFAWRFFSAFFGFLVIVLIYLISYKLFKNRLIALVASLAATLDGLLLTMSRIAMNDIYLVFFILLAFYLFLNKRYFFMSISLGLALASKWTGIFGILLLGGFYAAMQIEHYLKVKDIKRRVRGVVFLAAKLLVLFLVIPIAVYLLSYFPFFSGKHYAPGLEKSNVVTFINLQEQMYWYHTNLKAHHSYESKPIQWLFDLRPVWFFVDYREKTIANIYNLGNPLFMWVGFMSMIFLIGEYIKKRSKPLLLILISYLAFFLPWIFSPRIMFYYHYLPSVPFLAISFAYMLNEIFVKNRRGELFAVTLLALITVLFIYFFPLWTAIQIPKEFYETYFWIKTWK